ncbi:MAG: F0F1 ATP synthase subunit B [Planctomycetota bacterium]|nr:F0F1 ATP synthase subunit B [Planctomycetota bacterium]
MYMLLIEGTEQAHGGGGLDPFDPAGFGGMLWTWVIFLAALPFMWKVVMGPIAKALEARDEQAARAIGEAEKAREETAKARAEVESKLAEARAEAAKLVAEARERATAVERQITDEANARGVRMVAEAQAAIHAERDKALAAIREEVVDLSMAGARAVLGRNVGADDDRRLVSDMVGKLKAARK